MTKYKINPFVTVDGLACKTPIAFKRLTDRKMKQKGPDFSITVVINKNLQINQKYGSKSRLRNCDFRFKR